MAVITKKELKLKEVFDSMSNENDIKEFKKKFKELFPKDWKKIQATYNKEERKDTKHKGHPMPHPEVYLENMFKVAIKKKQLG